ncbi:MAG: TonB-dependent receptor [Sphingomonadales bacterium]|nr:TonB-dependent receptor [Sphingomonadales bacterium]
MTKRDNRTLRQAATGIATSFAALCFGLAGQSWAVEADTLALEEILVSAQRREESLQKVPIAITSFSAEQFNRSGLQTTLDLQYRTPGLVFTTNAALGQPYIRGIGTDIINVGTDPSVAVHIDGLYQTRAAASMRDLFDIERVEVVKGPQGTLYGRNATGGAINILTKEPSNEIEAAADLLYGNYDKKRARGMINVPLVENKVSFRASAFISKRDGFSYDALRDVDLDDEDVWGVRGKLRIDLSENLKLTLSADHSKERSTRNLAPKVNPYLPSPARDIFGAIIGLDPRVVNNNNDMFTNIDHTSFSAHLEWDLGEVVFKSISGYTKSKNDVQLDIDATEIDFSWDTENEDDKSFSQEFQLASANNDKFEWVVGAFYLHEKAGQHFQIFITPLAADMDYPVENRVDAYALFGQGSYNVSDKLRLTAGLRYSYEKKKGDFLNIVTDPFGLLTGVPGGGVFVSQSSPNESWKAWTPKFGIDYFINDDVMLYVSATRGFKSGGFNLLGSGEQFDPEYIWSYEAGFKSMLLDQRLRLNVAAFYYDYTDLQVNRFNPATGGATTSVTNAASAEVKGLEAEVLALLAKGLELDMGLAVLDAKYKDFLSANPDAPDPFVDQDLSGNTLPRSPKFSLSAGLQYTHDIGNYGSVTLRGEAKYQSHIWFDQFNSSDVEEDNYTLLNAFATFESADDRWRVQVYGRNLTDKLYRQSVIRATSLIGTLDFWGAPRTYGIEVGFRY